MATIGGLSAHAGQDLLVEYVETTRAAVKEIFLVHGEAGPAAALTEKLAGRGITCVHYPERCVAVEL